MKWIICELRCYAYLLRNLHRVRGTNRGGVLLRISEDGGFEFATWRGKRCGWAGPVKPEALAAMIEHRRIRRTLRHAFAEDPILSPRYGS